MKNTIRLTESQLKQIISESVTRILSEARKKRSDRTGTIEMNGEHIRATEDGVDKYGNPMYKVKHPSIKGRKTKDGYTRVQHFNFKPDRDISESVKKVLKESIKAADAMNAVSRETAQECGFKEEYAGVDGGFELWTGPLPKDPMERKALLNRLGIDRFTSENYMNNTCIITVDPSGKIANIGKKGGHPLLMKLAELLKQNKISSDKAAKILVSKGFDENKARIWVAKYTPKYEEYDF